MTHSAVQTDLALQDLIKSFRFATDEENNSVDNYIKEISRFYSGESFYEILCRLKGENRMLKITLINGNKIFWDELEYDDYKYDGKCLIITKNNEYVGIYNIDYIISVTRGEK